MIDVRRWGGGRGKELPPSPQAVCDLTDYNAAYDKGVIIVF